MAYLFREKINLLDLANLEQKNSRVLTVGVEDFLRDLYEAYLKKSEIALAHCKSVDAAHSYIKIYQPELLILGVEQLRSFQPTLSFLYQVRLFYPSLPVVSVGFDTDHQFLRQAMSAGVCSHIDRRHTRPQDVVLIVKSLLRNN
jgi:DNA-binding NtrC family response regulator